MGIKIEKEKRGWIRIVEAMIAIILIAAVVLIAISQSQRLNPDISEKVYTAENSMLTQVQLNSSARAEILNVSGSGLPLLWSGFPSLLPNTWEIINQSTLGSMQCEGQICLTSDPCLLGNPPGKTIYAQSVIIAANLTVYNPRLLKVFCW